MIISDKQLQLLMQILVDSIRVDISMIFTLDYETRHGLYQQIINQQSEELKDIEK